MLKGQLQQAQILAAEARAVETSNRFAWDLYSRLAQDDKNLPVLPRQPHIRPLDAACRRARGDEERDGEGASFRRSRLDRSVALRALSVSISAHWEQGDTTTAIADRIWIQKGCRSSIPKFASARFGSLSPDRSGSSTSHGETPRAIESINLWASKQTHGRIPVVVDRNSVDASTRIILANAIYFKGPWAVPFESVLTQEEPFFAQQGTLEVKTMRARRRNWGYVALQSAMVVELPYASTMTMVIILPAEGTPLASVERQLSTQFSAWLSAMKTTLVDVSLPHWTTRGEMDLEQTLMQMGMARLFQAHPDLSGISERAAVGCEGGSFT